MYACVWRIWTYSTWQQSSTTKHWPESLNYNSINNGGEISIWCFPSSYQAIHNRKTNSDINDFHILHNIILFSTSILNEYTRLEVLPRKEQKSFSYTFYSSTRTFKCNRIFYPSYIWISGLASCRCIDFALNDYTEKEE